MDSCLWCIACTCMWESFSQKVGSQLGSTIHGTGCHYRRYTVKKSMELQNNEMSAREKEMIYHPQDISIRNGKCGMHCPGGTKMSSHWPVTRCGWLLKSCWVQDKVWQWSLFSAFSSKRCNRPCNISRISIFVILCNKKCYHFMKYFK